MKSAKKTVAEHFNRKTSQGGGMHAEAGQTPSMRDIAATMPGTEAAVPSTPENEGEPPVAAPAADDRLLRLQADFDNYRKRVLREKEDLYQRANEDLMEALLPVLDHLDLAASFVDEERQDDAVIKGFSLLANSSFRY